jgi:hypothetical protein
MSRDPEPPRELEEIARALDQAGRLERETIAAARSAATPDETRLVQAALARAGAAPIRGGRRVWWIAAGLLVGALLLWRFLPRDAPERPGRVVLGEGQVEVLEPLGAVPGFTRLRWRTGSQGEPRYRVLVLDEATDDVLLERSDLRAFELPLDNHETRAWQRIRIEVYELDASGQPGRGAEAQAWRSP